jgi:molecular chaperone HscB
VNYFELLRLPIEFEIDLAVLNENYRQIQKTVHPDNFATGSDVERRFAMEQTTELNEALQTLKHPLKRAQYLLELQGFEIEEGIRNIAEDFLFEQLTLRETLSEINDFTDLNVFLAELETKIQRLLSEFQNNYQSKNWNSAQETVDKLQFLYKLHDQAMQLEETLA